ncbi:MAG TPA: S8 family serine peptidase, partial [Bacillaceae bacterium]
MTGKRRKVSSFLLVFFMVISMFAPYAGATEHAKTYGKPEVSESLLQKKRAIAEQMRLKEGMPKLHKSLQEIDGKGDVDVIIHLSEDSVALAEGKKTLNNQTFTAQNRKQVKEKVRKQQNGVKKVMEARKIIKKQGYSYETVLNGFAATVKAEDLNKLLDVPGVTLVEPDAERHAFEDPEASGASANLHMDTSISFLGIERLWDKGLEGSGVRVAVLDTGIDYKHPDFKDVYKGGWNFVPHTNSNEYARPREADDPYETTPLDKPDGRAEFNSNGSSFYTSHGTHVAGTIAALGENEYGIKGIAPKVDLYAYRVLGAYGSGQSSWIIAAIEKSVEEKMDIINLSLGGGSNTSISADSFAINNAMLAGTLAVMATGNAGPKRGTMGTPATSPLGVAVGNTTNPEAKFSADAAIKAGDFDNSLRLQLMATTYAADPSAQLEGDFEIVNVPGVGKAADYESVNVQDKVALVARGEIPFVDKIAAAKHAGARAVIVHNIVGGTNAPGPSNVFLSDDFEFIPAFDMSQTDGEVLRAALNKSEGAISFSNIQKSFTDGDEVNESSSRGPATPFFDIKPDVSAPGTNIMSAIPMYGKDNPEADYKKAFSRMTGTSMATPHISGIAALIMQANPDWDVFDVKASLSNTAKILDVKKYDVFSQGAGRVQAYEAAFPGALAYGLDKVDPDGKGTAIDYTKGTVTFGHFPEIANNPVTATKEVLVRNFAGSPSEYTVSVELTKSFGQAKVTVDKPEFTLNSEQLLTVKLEVPKTSNKAGDEVLGYIHITDGETSLSLPFAADFSPKSGQKGISEFKLDDLDVSFNGDGVKDQTRLNISFLSDVADPLIELWDVMNPAGGPDKDGYIGYLFYANALEAGSYFLNITGTYFPWGGSERTAIPDSLYLVEMAARNPDGDPAYFFGIDGPLFVKSTPANIKSAKDHVAKEATYVFSGTIEDKYIEYQKTLLSYGVGFDVNTKLATRFELKDKDGTSIQSGLVRITQDGNFTITLKDLTEGANSVTIFVNDAAGNTAEKTFPVTRVIEKTELALDKTSLHMKTGETEQLKVTFSSIIGDKETKTDVTEAAEYTGYNPGVVQVKAGKVTAVGAGETNITVSYGKEKATVTV